MIFNLPRLVHFHVLDFLDLKAIARVDTAYIQGHRYFSRVWLRDFTFKEQILLNGLNGKWFWMRGALLENIKVECSAGCGAFSNIMVHQGHSIKTVDFSDFDFTLNEVDNIFFEELMTFCPSITHMMFIGCGLSAAQLGQLVKGRSNLVSLDISWPDAESGEALNSIWENCTALQVLNMVAMTVPAEGLLGLVGKKTAITSLDLSDVTGLTDLGLATIFNACPQLTNLNLCDLKISSAALTYLAHSCSGLQSLHVDISEASNDSIASLATECTHLHTLVFDKTDINDDTLSLVAEKFLHLRTLSLQECIELTSSGLLSVALYCTNLTSLDVSNTDVSYRTVYTVLTKCESLNQLIVRGCPGEITDTNEVVAEYTKNEHMLLL